MQFRLEATSGSSSERLLDIANRISLTAAPAFTMWDGRKSPDYKAIFVTVTTLEELLDLSRVVERPLIIDFQTYEDDPTIEIYDDYRE